MKLRIVAVGAIKDAPTRALLDRYRGRLSRYCAFEEVEVRAGRSEGRDLVKAVGESTLVALDVGGEAMSSQALARRVERLASLGKGEVSFVIGGAEGLPPAILKAARERWSLSSLTFPHRLARLLLAEQLYRAMTILRGEPYDK